MLLMKLHNELGNLSLSVSRYFDMTGKWDWFCGHGLASNCAMRLENAAV